MITRRVSFALVFACLALLGGFTHASDRDCGTNVVDAVGAFFRLEDFYYPYPKEGGKLIAQSCKSWPADPTKTIAAFVYDDGHLQKKFLLALVSSATNAVVSSYSDWMPEEDAVTRIGRGSVKLDTAPYVLSKKTGAFGVVFDINWLPCAVEGGTSQELQLFIADGNRIRPIFESSLPIYYWRRETTDCFNPGRTFSTPITVQVLKSASNGFFDLKLTARESEDIDSPPHEILKRSFSYTVKYDGKNYDLFPWSVKFSCWYDGSTCTSP